MSVGIPGSERMVVISTSTVLKMVGLGLALWLIWYLRAIFALFFISILLAALIEPLATSLAKKKVPKGLTVIGVYILLLAGASLVVVQLIPAVVTQSGELVKQIVVNYDQWVNSVDGLQSLTGGQELLQKLPDAISSVQGAAAQSVSSVFSTVKGFFGGVATLSLVLVLTFYLVMEENALRKFFSVFIPDEYQPYVVGLLSRMQLKMGDWLRAQLLLGSVVGLFVYIGLTLLGVPYALLLAILAGLLEMIPYLGPLLSTIPAAVIAFGQGPFQGVGTLGLYIVIQQVENNVLVPKLMQKVTGLNPIVSILALMIGVKIGGVVGALLSVPVAAMTSVAVEDFLKEHT